MKATGGSFLLGCGFVFLLSLFFSQYMGAVEVEDGKEELLKTLIVHNEAARKRIHSYIIEQEWNSVELFVDDPDRPAALPKEDVKSRLWMRLTRKDRLILFTRTEHLETVSGNWKEERFLQGVLNPNYYAQYIRDPVHMVHLWEHNSLDAMQPQAQSFSTTWFPKPCAIDYAFGDYPTTLGGTYEKDLPKIRWSVTEENLDGDSVYRITLTNPMKDGKRKRILNYFLDPRKDFLMRRLEAYQPAEDHVPGQNLSLLIEVDLQFLETAKAWAPRKVHYKEYENTQTELWMTVKKVQLNPVIDDAIFNIGSFEILNNTRLCRYPANGTRRIEYRYVQGAWVPK